MQPSPISILTMMAFSAASFGANMVNAFSNAALPLFLASYHLPNALIGFLAQERSFVGGIAQPVIGLISDRTQSRWGRRKPFFLVGVPLTAVSLLLLATHPPVWVVLVLLLVFSFFLAIANDPYLALMADITPSEQRGRMGAVMAVFNMAGQVAMLALAALFWESHEPWVFAAIGAGLLISFGITFLGVQEPSEGAAPPKLTGLTPARYIRDVLEHRELAKYATTQFFFWFGGGAAVPFLTRFAVDVLHTDESVAFQLLLLAVLSAALAAVPAGMIADRFGKKRTLSYGLALYTVAALGGSQAANVAQAAVAMVALGVANGAATALIYPLLADLLPPGRKGEFTGLGSLVWSLAQPLGATAAGLAVDLTGTFRAVFLIAGILIGLSLIGLQTVHPERVLSDGPGQAGTPLSAVDQSAADRR